jgi:hypothetical protein
MRTDEAVAATNELGIGRSGLMCTADGVTRRFHATSAQIGRATE